MHMVKETENHSTVFPNETLKHCGKGTYMTLYESAYNTVIKNYSTCELHIEILCMARGTKNYITEVHVLW